jgi:hypothetical protein
VACALGYPAFGGGFLAPPVSDQYLGGYAVREFGTAMLRSGHLPLWNPYLFGGMPFIAAFDGDIFYPPTLLMRLIMPADRAVTWAFTLHVMLAGWFTYGWLRATGLPFAAAMVGGFAYELGGPVSSYVLPGHDGKLYVSAILPLALWLTVRGVRDGRRWSWPALALAVGCAALSPHPQLLEYLLLTLAAYALFVAIDSTSIASRETATRRLGATAAAVTLGLAISAVQFIPVAQFVAWSPRGSPTTGAGTYAYATQFSMPVEDLPNVYLPQFSGMLEHYWGGLGTHWSSEYLGAAVLVLAGAGLLAPAPDRWRGVRFWVGLAIVGTLWSLGNHTPLYHLVYALVPGTRYFRVPAAAVVVVSLAVAALAADGAASVLKRRVRVRYAVAWAAAAALVALPPVVGALTEWTAQHLGAPWTPGLAAANAGAAARGALRCLGVVVLATGVIALRRDDKLSAGVTGVALTALVALDLWSVERHYWRFASPAAMTFASDAAIDTLRHEAQPVRVLAWPIGHAQQAHDAEIAGDGLMIHRLRQVLGYHGNSVKRYDDLSWTTDGSQPLFTPHLWRLLNIGYVLTTSPQLPFGGGTRVVGPIVDAAGDSIYLYRLVGAHPVAWLTTTAMSLPDTLARLQVIDSSFDLDRIALLEPAARLAPPVPVGPTSAPPGPVTATRYEPGRMQFAFDRPSPPGAMLVVSENYYPGWQATANGSPLRVWRADYALIGVRLPAGTTAVDLTFSSPAATVGFAVTALAALTALVWLTLALRTPRRA